MATPDKYIPTKFLRKDVPTLRQFLERGMKHSWDDVLRVTASKEELQRKIDRIEWPSLCPVSVHTEDGIYSIESDECNFMYVEWTPFV